MPKPNLQLANVQPILEGVDDAIREQIANDLRLGKEYETLRLENGREEQKYKKSAAALMDKYNMTEFEFGEGTDRVAGFFEETRKLKVRVGDADTTEPSDE